MNIWMHNSDWNEQNEQTYCVVALVVLIWYVKIQNKFVILIYFCFILLLPLNFSQIFGEKKVQSHEYKTREPSLK